jgi:hypothetical protein
LFFVLCSLFFVLCSLFFVLCSLFFVLCSLFFNFLGFFLPFESIFLFRSFFIFILLIAYWEFDAFKFALGELNVKKTVVAPSPAISVPNPTVSTQTPPNPTPHSISYRSLLYLPLTSQFRDLEEKLNFIKVSRYR